MHGQIRVGMGHLHEWLPNGDGDAEFLAAFPDECLRFGFTGFHLTADKFPQKTARFVRWTLADQKSVALPDEGGNNFGYHHAAPVFRDRS